MVNSKKSNAVCAAMLAATAFLGACTSLPPMQDPQTYTTMNCEALSRERAAVEANKNYHEDNSSFGFIDLLGAVAEGLAMGAGNASLASQQHAANAQLQQSHDSSKETADAYARRTELLDKVSAVRKCS
ncbi:hypothetical protein [Ralstonia flatus]|uniref:Lipoprotein n=1 Tax=Ralstonia flatus TaxID=3058601 RepID=A0ABM9KZM5_9RALS|nr:hypothetical protein [Ralstonia sp. LMG 32965]MBN6209410.1 hypothetical protein [Ralstonia pickettii]CAJ0893805.1 hypothetical protein R77564_03743 [Ralstonia sp. LMG 32965]